MPVPFPTTADFLSHDACDPPGPVGAILTWVRPNAWASGDGAHRTWFAYGTFNAGGYTMLQMQRFTDNNIYVGTEQNAITEQRVIAADTGLFTDGRWRGFVFQWDCPAGKAWLYTHDGVLVGQRSSGYTFLTPVGSMRIGCSARDLTPTIGAVSDLGPFARWNRLLRPEEVSGLLNVQRPRDPRWYPHMLAEYVPMRHLNGALNIHDYQSGKRYTLNQQAVPVGTIGTNLLAMVDPPAPLIRRPWFRPSFVAADKTIWQLPAHTAPALEDLLVAVDDPSGTPITKKLALTNFAALTVSNVAVQVKTSGSGTYTPTAGMKKVLVICVGGGGGGAGGLNTDSAGGGGGGGATAVKLFTAADIGASQAYAVGAASAAAGAGNTSGLGTANALLQATGGGAGTAGATFSVVGVTVAGGAGGTATGGDLNISGQRGGRGVIFSGADGLGGKGGNSVFGKGGAPGGTNVAGGNGSAYGGGGAGGHASATADRDGGTGAAGVIYFIEFIG